jgi:hypothetical protein
MKSGHRRRLDKANTPRDLVNQFRELQELRIKVQKAELATAKKKAVDAETQAERNGSGKTINRSRTH